MGLSAAKSALMVLRFVVNDVAHELEIEPCETLVEVLRDRLGLNGTKVSCDAQVCGSCTVLLDGLPVSACGTLAADADGRAVRTVEGLATRDGRLSGLQQAFVEHSAFQCGYCTPGFLMAATGLIADEPHPTRRQVIDALEGNICRCTGYESIIEAVLAAASAEPGG